MPITGFSMVKSYRRCPKQYEYKYIQNLQRIMPPPPLIRGSIIHEILDMRAVPGGTKGYKSVLTKYEEKYGTLFKEEQEMYGDDFLANIERVYQGYLREWDDTDLEYMSSEEFISTPLVGDILFQGHIDKRIFKDGRMWVMDHKTHKNIPTEEQRFNDYQLLMYVWAYNREHPKDKVDGVIWDYIRTKPPTIPEVLQKGGLSQAKNIDTDVYTYTKELVRHRLDQKPYRVFLAELAKRSRGKFYQRVYLPAPTKAMMEQVVQDFAQSSQIMHGLGIYPRSPSRECSWCEYYRICNAELRGLDHKFIRESEYKVEEVSGDTAEED
jgi:hypothetical protein